jgi:hypothetical protein
MQIARSAPWLILLIALVVRPAMAVVIDSGDGSGNTSAPPDDPGWSNVGVIGGHTTGVYLENHWVLTAGHSRVRELQLGDRLFEPVQGKIEHRISAESTPRADLKLFQLRERPNLPALRLARSAPRVDTAVVMIGNGRTRSASRTGWSLAGAIVPLSDASYAGYKPAGGSALRWGTNRIAAVDLLLPACKRTSRSFATQFDAGLPTPHEAQAISGDSGGPVFAKDGEGRWELVGIMFTVAQRWKQPGILTVYGDATFAVDIHAYREQIEKIVASSPDHDRDGILDIDDNCTRVRNRDQADEDGDGTGDVCEEPEDGEGPGPEPKTKAGKKSTGQ